MTLICHEPRWIHRIVLWVAILALVLVAAAPWVFACDYTPAPETIPPKIEIMAV